jgi:hypothetical protein
MSTHLESIYLTEDWICPERISSEIRWPPKWTSTHPHLAVYQELNLNDHINPSTQESNSNKDLTQSHINGPKPAKKRVPNL